MSDPAITQKLTELEEILKRNIHQLADSYRIAKHTPELGLFEERQFLRRVKSFVEVELRDLDQVIDNPAEFSR